MSRKKDAQILALENKINTLTTDIDLFKKSYNTFVQASKEDWKHLREYCNQKIEGK